MNNRNDKELFKLVSTYKPTGDQPEAIAKLVEGIKRGDKEQTLLGVTGSGKTFTTVSYTHLDVYKRQIVNIFRFPVFSLERICGEQFPFPTWTRSQRDFLSWA